MLVNAMAERVPRLVAGVDVRKFKLDPMDGFLLTRIDGRLGTKDLARETGLPDFSVERALEKLEKLGVIERIDPNAPPPPRQADGAAAAPAQPRPALPTFSALLEPKYDAQELEEVCDLTADQKKRILDLFYRLDDLDHYTLLSVTRESDKKSVKRSYYEFAANMHPDRFFKKNLGSFKAKMEVVFARVTEAHDTLVDAEKRAEYDAYLAEVATTRGMEAMLERALAEAQAVPAAAPSVPPARASSPGPAATPGPTGPSPEELKARREALARRLLGGSVRPPSASSAPPQEAPNPLRYSNSADAVDALRRRYEDRIESAHSAQARKYAQAAEDALAKNDVVAASSALSLAVKFAPNDTALAMRYQEIKNRADAVLIDSYTKQGQYEERQERWAEAARSWQKIAKLRPLDPRAHERAASCITKADGDLHEAAEHAKKAVAAEPSNVAYHVTLAEVYLKAGLFASARRAAETGLGVEPKHAGLTAILKRTGKG